MINNLLLENTIGPRQMLTVITYRSLVSVNSPVANATPNQTLTVAPPPPHPTHVHLSRAPPIAALIPQLSS